MWVNKFINGFSVSYGLIKIEVSESSTPCIITHDVELETVSRESVTEGHFKGLSKYCSKVLFAIYMYY